MMWRIKLDHIDLCVKLLFGAVKVEMSSNTTLFVLFIYLFFFCSINKIAYPFVTVSIKQLQLTGRKRL